MKIIIRIFVIVKSYLTLSYQNNIKNKNMEIPSSTFKSEIEKEPKNLYRCEIVKYNEKGKHWEYIQKSDSNQSKDKENISPNSNSTNYSDENEKDDCKIKDSIISNKKYYDSSFIQIDQLKIITYNIWFDKYNWENRLINIAKICETKNPDIICFQEVTDDFINFIFSLKFIQERYYITYIPSQLKNWYDVAILSKYKCNAYIVPYISRMGRKLVYITLINNSNDLIKIGTTHLESLNNSKIRENQLLLSYDILDSLESESIGFKNTHSFLLGDFNFSEKENTLITDQGYIDIGLEILNKQLFLCKSNEEKNECWKKWCTMKEMKGYPAWRPDRITFKTKSKSFCVKHFEIIGSDSIKILDINNPVDTPSDHYGIYMECNL